ncbi:hypothetical protein [Actibacterium lipolyticum]|uniref:Uncharacterized protein n=1 Tax=Actibacterium lipolyticum TaxID=1524263 RepID=A0A238JZ07_9RHOB|nr:hypothetical protein [Actibacterium lipolyticum]SMX35082.1 hypothetical protein COL8621_01640 [Actibacterium lipolyticum]
MPEYSKIEQEVIVLNAIWGLIDEMVNFDMYAEDWSVSWSNIQFKSSTHARLFNVLLVDFLSLPQKHYKEFPFDLDLPQQDVPKSERTYLFLLKKILEDPQLAPHNIDLDHVVDEFGGWLSGDTVIKDAWFRSLNLKIDMKIERVEALKMTGDICKHNFTRLSARAKSLQRAFERNGQDRDIDDCFIALPEFQDWFHVNSFLYQASQISEFLNRLRWAIYDYLRTEFERAYQRSPGTVGEIPRYTFDVPEKIKNELARAKYRELMNLVRKKPILPKFTVADSMKVAFASDNKKLPTKS